MDGFSLILRDMLTVNATLVAQTQNEEMRAFTMAMALMVATCLGLYVVFKRRDWL